MTEIVTPRMSVEEMKNLFREQLDSWEENNSVVHTCSIYKMDVEDVYICIHVNCIAKANLSEENVEQNDHNKGNHIENHCGYQEG